MLSLASQGMEASEMGLFEVICILKLGELNLREL